MLFDFYQININQSTINQYPPWQKKLFSLIFLKHLYAQVIHHERTKQEKVVRSNSVSPTSTTLNKPHLFKCDLLPMPYPQPRVRGWDSTPNVTGSTKAPISSQSNVNAVAAMMRGQLQLQLYSHRPKQASVIHLPFDHCPIPILGLGCVITCHFHLPLTNTVSKYRNTNISFFITVTKTLFVCRAN